MQKIIALVLLTTAYAVFSQQLQQKEVILADSTLLKTGGRIIILTDNSDFCVFTDYDVFLEAVKSYSSSPAAKKIYDVFMNYKDTGNIIADSVVNDPGLYEKWRMVKGVVISSGKVLIINKNTWLLEKQMIREIDKNMCTTLKTGDKTIFWYCMGQN